MLTNLTCNRDALTKGQTFYIKRDHGLENLDCVGGGSFHSWKFRPVLPDLLASQLVLQNRDSLWDALSQQQSQKHAGVVPAGRWTEECWSHCSSEADTRVN